MSWKRLFARFKKPKPTSYQGLDHKLVKSTQSSFIPRAAQFKYVGHFLSSTEKRIVLICGLIVLVSGTLCAILFVSSHLVRIPKEGGEYEEALIGQPKLINPLYAGLSDVDTDLTSLMYAGLFHFTGEGKIEPYLASDYTISADQKTYEVTLRQGALWSDGEPINADDIVFTFDLIQNPETGSPLLPAFQGVKVERIDDYKIRFTLKDPYAPFLSSLTVGILPMHIWSEIPPTNLKLAKQNLQPIAAGPWQFNKLFKNETGQIANYVVVKNERFFGQKPYLKSLKFTFFNEYREAIEAMRTNNTMGLSFIPHALESKLNKRTVATYPINLPQYTALFFNQTAEPDLKNDDVRLALAQAVDKEKIVVEALDSYGTPVESPVLESEIGFNPNLKKITPDTEAANKALDKKWTSVEPEDYFKLESDLFLKNNQTDIDAFKKANSTTPDKIIEYEEQVKKDIAEAVRKNMDPEQTFYRKSKDAGILDLTITTIDTPEYSKAAELISKMWQSVGVKTSLQKVNQQIMREIIKKRNYEVLLYGEILGVDPDPFPFWHSSQNEYPGLNLAGYSNREADKVLDQARVTTDDKKREELYKKFQEYVQADIPAIFLYSPVHTLAINRQIQGVNIKNINNPSDRFSALNSWYIKTSWQWK